jgi:hypothetical protein
MEKPKKVKYFPSDKEYTGLTFEKCVQSITGVERTDRAMNWMERYLKDQSDSKDSKDTWFHKKEVPEYVYAAGTSRMFARWKREEIARSASERGKRRAPRFNISRRDKPLITALKREADQEKQRKEKTNP